LSDIPASGVNFIMKFVHGEIRIEMSFAIGPRTRAEEI
jgi:hypothetical protein